MPDQDDVFRVLQEMMNRHAFELEEAIEAHHDWREALEHGIATRDWQHSYTEVACDECCKLGRWLHQAADEVRADAAWQRVHDAHVLFHHEASEVVKLAQTDRMKEAVEALWPGSKFERASARLLELLQEWRDAA
ncbi:MAG: CZB domain-containing protein [Candidatus Eisenbacteria bacterium]|uniref:CZB domain-containing protein n=1 Tax=Eiseniibacteriota bacterium TaxID=2212470 RepID=A0A933SD98_UNCEI|nr:CZB domain-containing protein [Candidatus Eisenbacteria bacterium]